jgi:hypothetical protein
VNRCRVSIVLQSFLVCFLLTLALACDRKAPSPEECLDFAMRGLRVNDERLLAVPAVKDKVDEVVIKCLTTPYDKALIGCVKTRSSTQSCLVEFEARERQRGQPIDR